MQKGNGCDDVRVASKNTAQCKTVNLSDVSRDLEIEHVSKGNEKHGSGTVWYKSGKCQLLFMILFSKI